MGLFKIAAAIFIIVAGFIGSILIIRGSGQISEDKLAGAKNQKEAEILSAGENPIQWLAERENGQKENYLKESAADDLGVDSNNLTKTVARTIFSGMRQMDEENKNPAGYFNPSSPNNENNQKTIETAISNLKNPLSSLDTSVSDKELNILLNNSDAEKKNYLKLTAEIIMNNSNEFFRNPLKALEKLIYGDASAINQVVYSYSEIYKSFLTAPVPFDWLNLHKRYLEVLKKSEFVYRGMADFQNDPVKAALLGEKLTEIIGEEVAIRKEYYDKEKELGI